MPTIAKQVAKPSTNGIKPSTGSILSQAIPVSELKTQFVKMVIYGPNRVGKTTLGCDFPKPALLVAYEPNLTGGALSVTRIAGVKYIKITSTKDSFTLANELARSSEFKTVILDGATSLGEIILREICGDTVQLEQLNFGLISTDQYRQRAEDTKKCLRPYLDLPMHTVILAKEKDHNPPKEERNKIIRGLQTESFFAADVGGSAAGWLHDNCDYIAQLQIVKEIISEPSTTKFKGSDGTEKSITTHVLKETGKMVRRLRTMYHPNYAAGCRAPDPSIVPEFVINPTFEKINKLVNGIKLDDVDAVYPGTK